ncbi:MAG: hypothetical protein KGI41_03055 [Patescibacteria group bacterium]|nr:hypothetical protein [Patescibacteria group bacterium]MDE1966193.1 hypothetical protein [Patescibacteria group bacterium]
MGMEEAGRFSKPKDETLRNARTDAEQLETEAPPDTPQPEDGALLKERDVANPEELDARSYSKERLSKERSELSAQLSAERRALRDNLSEIRVRASLLEKKVESAGFDAEQARAELDALRAKRDERANSLVGKVKAFLGIETGSDRAVHEAIAETHEEIDARKAGHEAAAKEYEDALGELASADESLKGLKGKIAEHYQNAELFMQRDVEQILLRNNAFMVHTFLEGRGRHNDNSNVSKETGFADDLDILLAFEPSISASSVMPGADAEGNISALWTDDGAESGVLIAGGNVSHAGMRDIGSISEGIKRRTATASSNMNDIARLDEIVQERGGKLGENNRGAYNELVVNNPEAAAFFSAGMADEKGTMWMTGLNTRERLKEVHDAYESYKRNPEGTVPGTSYDGNPDVTLQEVYRRRLAGFKQRVNDYRERLELAKSRGLPVYVMTPDRRFLEIRSVTDSGTIETGEELTPAQLAKGRAGLQPQKRKEIGHELLTRPRKIFRYAATEREAREILKDIPDEDAAEGAREERGPLPFTRASLDAVLDNPAHTPEDVLALFDDRFADAYGKGAGVSEGYTIREHTGMVLNQFLKYFGDALPEEDRKVMETMLAIHDIGKPAAIAAGSKYDQHRYTTPIVRETLEGLGFGEKEVALATALVDGDPIGDFLKGGSVSRAAERIVKSARESGRPLDGFYGLLKVFYQSDAGSYTEDAGGKRSLDRLFSFDPEAGEMRFSPEVERRIRELDSVVKATAEQPA